MNTIPKLSFLSVCLLFSFLTPSQSEVVCNPHDKKVLLQIKRHFNKASYFSIWDPKTDCCNWLNVFCNEDDNPGRVSSLTVAYDSDVVGEIPAVVGNLPYLESLRFFELPNMTGPIPSTIAKLSKLQVVDLTSNRLTGPIPDFLSQIKSLQILDLSWNTFTGTIPSSLSLLPNLINLDLSRNKLKGSIPKSFGSFKTGLYLRVSQSQLRGTIPRSLGHANLTGFDVSENQLSGDVSFIFGRNKIIDSIILRKNKFKFDFSEVDLPQGLRNIDISHNNIYGSLPRRLGQVPLQSIDVSNNQLCGQMPTGRRLKQFPAFRFAHNKCLCGVPLPPCNNN